MTELELLTKIRPIIQDNRPEMMARFDQLTKAIENASDDDVQSIFFKKMGKFFDESRVPLPFGPDATTCPAWAAHIWAMVTEELQ